MQIRERFEAWIADELGRRGGDRPASDVVRALILLGSDGLPTEVLLEDQANLVASARAVRPAGDDPPVSWYACDVVDGEWRLGLRHTTQSEKARALLDCGN